MKTDYTIPGLSLRIRLENDLREQEIIESSRILLFYAGWSTDTHSSTSLAIKTLYDAF